MYNGKKVPDYAVDGKGSGDLKKSAYGSIIKKGKAGMIAETDMMQYGKGGYKMKKGGKVHKGKMFRKQYKK